MEQEDRSIDFDEAVDNLAEMFPKIDKETITQELVKSDYNFQDCLDNLVVINNKIDPEGAAKLNLPGREGQASEIPKEQRREHTPSQDEDQEMHVSEPRPKYSKPADERSQEAPFSFAQKEISQRDSPVAQTNRAPLKTDSPEINIAAELEKARPKNLTQKKMQDPANPPIDIAAEIEKARPRNNPNYVSPEVRLPKPESPVKQTGREHEFQDFGQAAVKNSLKSDQRSPSPQAVESHHPQEHEYQETEEDQPEIFATPQQVDQARRAFFGNDYSRVVQQLNAPDRAKDLTFENVLRPSKLLATMGAVPGRSSVPVQFQFTLSNLGSAEFNRDRTYLDILANNHKERDDRILAQKLQMEFLQRAHTEEDQQMDSSHRPSLGRGVTQRIGN